MKKLLIEGGRIIDPETRTDKIADVLIEDGRIAAIDPADKPLDAEAFDASGLLVIPGAIDLHVHLRDFEQSQKETIQSGTRAALHGGVTTVLAMPNTRPALDSEESIKKYQELIDETAECDVMIAGAITTGLQGRSLAPFERYKSMGLKWVTDDGFDVNDEALLKEAYEKAKASGFIVMTHPEIDAIGKDGVMNEGELSRQLGTLGQPNEKEWKAVERGIRLALETGARAHMTHLSTKESIELIRQAKKQTDLVTCDVTPHHFCLTEREVQEKGGVAKVNPPLRTEADRQAVIEGIKDGTVDFLVTDHAPHSLEEKETDLTKAAFGFTGLEILVPAAIDELHFKQGIDLMKVVDLLTYQPAKLAGLPVGRLQEGARADLTLIDLNSEKEVISGDFQSMGKVTPLIGRRLKGWNVGTIYKGILHQD